MPKRNQKNFRISDIACRKKFESVIGPDEKGQLDFNGTLLESAAFVFQYPLEGAVN